MYRLVLVMFCLVWVGCNEGTAPVIENLEIESTSLVVGAENIVTFALDFSDSDGDVELAQVHIVSQEDGATIASGTSPIDDAVGVEAGRFSGTFAITPQTAGFFYFRVTVLDASRNESNELSESLEAVDGSD